MSKFIKRLKLKKHKDVFVLLAVISLSAIIYSLSSSNSKYGGLFSGFFADSVYYAYRVVDYPVKLTGEIYGNYIDLLSVKAENEKLKTKLRNARFELNKIKEYGIENRELRKILLLRDTMGRKTIPAMVMLHGIQGWFFSLYINRGRKDGVKTGNGVISYDGVVGRVVYAGDAKSRVIPITSPKCVFSVIDANTGTIGIVKGTGSGYLKMMYVFNSKKIKEGDKILTSGLGGVFTAGINVGSVAVVDKKSYDIFQRITILPYKNLFNSRYVLVEK